MTEISIIRRTIGVILLCIVTVMLFLNNTNSNITTAILVSSIFMFIIWTVISIHYENRDALKIQGNKEKVDINRRRFLYYSAVTFATILTLESLSYVKIQSENMVYNGNFTLGFNGWSLPQPSIFNWEINKSCTYNGLPSLEVQTGEGYTYSLLWSWISSKLIKVNYNHQYKIVTHMAGSNVLQSSIVIQPYDKNGKQLNFQLSQIPSGINGTFGFKEFETTLTIPYGVEYIGIYLLAGLAFNSDNLGKTYFSDLSITETYNLF